MSLGNDKLGYYEELQDEDPILVLSEGVSWAMPGRFKDIYPAFPAGRKRMQGWRKHAMALALYITTGSWPKEIHV